MNQPEESKEKDRNAYKRSSLEKHNFEELF